MKIGIDFDNTIASYDEAMHRGAVDRGWISPAVPKIKKAVRDAIRALDGGESKWRALQVFSYGPGMPDAKPMTGVKEFLTECKTRQIPIWVVSHKTEDANFGAPNVKLREAAMNWLEEQGFVDSSECGVGRGSIFFEDTREAKIERIRELRVTHFIDDLEETFLEASFPRSVEQILLSPQPANSQAGTWRRFESWADIRHAVFAK